MKHLTALIPLFVFASFATAQPKAPPVTIDDRVTALEDRVAKLEAALAQPPKLTGSPKVAAAKNGCDACDCPCVSGQSCTCVKCECVACPGRTKVVASEVKYRNPVGHTHTCPKCRTTWDHSTNPSHNCPNCGTAQYVQDHFPRSVTVTDARAYAPTYAAPTYSYSIGSSYGGGCAGGSCGVQGAFSSRGGIFGRRR